MRRASAFGRVSAFALVVALAGCTSNPDAAETTPSVEPSVAPGSSPSPTEEAPAFPTEAFADDPTPAPTEPASGELVLYLRSFNPGYGEMLELASASELAVYADGRVIWFAHEREGYLQMRLTPEGVERLRSKAVSTGLFEHDLALGIDPGWGHMEVRRGDRSVIVAWGRKPVAVSALGMQDSFVAATPAQASELIELEAFFRDPTAWGLPPHMYVQPQISPFVPTYLWVGFDRHVPDYSELPSPAREILTSASDGGCGVISLVQAREIARAVAQAGLKPTGLYGEMAGLKPTGLYGEFPFTLDDVRDGIAFNMPGEGSSTSLLHIHPTLPHESICD